MTTPMPVRTDSPVTRRRRRRTTRPLAAAALLATAAAGAALALAPAASADSGLGWRVVQVADTQHFQETNGDGCNPYSWTPQVRDHRCPALQAKGDWNGAFARYAWAQAGADVHSVTATPSSFRHAGTWHPGTSHAPSPGDVMVIGGGDGRVAVVDAVQSATSVRVVVGDDSDRVQVVWVNPQLVSNLGHGVRGYASPVKA